MLDQLSSLLNPTNEATFVNWLVQGLVYGSVLAGIAWLVAKLGRRTFRPAFLVALWSIVLIKFVMPTGPAWSYSLANAFKHVPAVKDIHGSADLLSNDGMDLPGIAGSASPSKLNATSIIPWSTILALSYASIVAALTAYRITGYRRFHKTVLALPVANRKVDSLVRRVCQEIGVRRPPVVRINDQAPSPFVVGFIEPQLVLPNELLTKADALETVIVHEVAHLRRGDMLVRYLQWTTGTLLFFWPVVAWVNRRIDEAREVACDEWALRQGKLSPGDYARCLLSIVRSEPNNAPAFAPACMASNPSTIERRIDMILENPTRPRRRPTTPLFAAALIAVWGGFALAGAPGEEVHEAHGDHHFKMHHGHHAGNAATKMEIEKLAQSIHAQIEEAGTADVNSDGIVTPNEINAFLVAVALQMPAAMIEQFPRIDADDDGDLSLLEAARLLHRPHRQHFGRLVKRIPDGQMEAKFGRDGDNASFGPKHRPHGKAAFFGRSLAMRTWILDNMPAAPTTDEVSSTASAIVELHIQEVFKRHPEADINEDGVLTQAEMEQFHKEMTEKRMQMMLERHPDMAEKMEAMRQIEFEAQERAQESSSDSQ